jgi:hypothetical protein
MQPKRIYQGFRSSGSAANMTKFCMVRVIVNEGSISTNQALAQCMFEEIEPPRPERMFVTL